jgi:hypothetical protein
MNMEQERRSDESSPNCELEKLYRIVPGWREVLTAVEAGRIEFVNLLGHNGLLDRFGEETSEVHGYHEVQLHAFILAIVSADRWAEIKTKSFLTYASHWIDDFFDSPAKVPDPERLLDDRHDIVRALTNLGAPGIVGFEMARCARHPLAVMKALHRMLYGGLVQRSTDQSQRGELMSEYRDVATKFVSPELIGEIQRIEPASYWTTNKTVLELLSAAELELDYTRCELWNLIYAPAIYCQDVEEERARGELNFGDDAPVLEDMLGMIRLGHKHLCFCEGYSDLSIRQLDFVLRSVPNLPREIVSEYQMIRDQYRSVEPAPTQLSLLAPL